MASISLTKSCVKQYFFNISLFKHSIFQAIESSNCPLALLEVWEFGCHLKATIRITSENGSVVDSEAYSVAFKTLISIIFQAKYSAAFLLVILSSKRSNSIWEESKPDLEILSLTRWNSLISSRSPTYFKSAVTRQEDVLVTCENGLTSLNGLPR